MKLRSAENVKLHHRRKSHLEATSDSADDSENDSASETDEPQPVPQPQRERMSELWWPLNKVPVWGWVLIAILAIIFVFCVLKLSENSDEYIKEKINKTVHELKQEFPNQSNNLWEHVSYVLQTVSNKDNSCPRVLLLLSRGDQASKNSIDCVIGKLANSSKIILGWEPLYLKEVDIKCDGCVSKIRSEIQNIRAVIIEQLETFSVEALKKLHYFCDEYETDFGKAAYLLTLTVEGSKNDKAGKLAEKKIRDLWSPVLHADYLEPLISRLTSLVEFVTPEEHLVC